MVIRKVKLKDIYIIYQNIKNAKSKLSNKLTEEVGHISYRLNEQIRLLDIQLDKRSEAREEDLNSMKPIRKPQ